MIPNHTMYSGPKRLGLTFLICGILCLLGGHVQADTTQADAHEAVQTDQAPALPVQQADSQRIENAGIGFSYELPAGWDEMSPLLMGLYNSASGKLASGEGAPYLVAGYSATGSGVIPPILLILFIEQQIVAETVVPLNKMFVAEARDVQGKTAIARRLHLASEVRFVKEEELRPGTPLVFMEADTTFGFTARIMASPFYSANGMIVVTYFAPLDDFGRYESEMLDFFRNVKITDSLPYLGCPLSPANKRIKTGAALPGSALNAS